MRRFRKAKIVATLGPSSASAENIEKLFIAGADTFRLNFSHGHHEDHAQRHQMVRNIERHYNRPIAILADLQGPKLRIGVFGDDRIFLKAGGSFTFDTSSLPGNIDRVCLPHPEIYACVKVGHKLLLDDGKITLRVIEVRSDSIKCEVVFGGELSNRKGVNIPDATLPISALTPKDRKDLEFALRLGVDWVALSFVQKPQDILEARELVGTKAKIMAKLEKPMAIEHLDEIIELADGIMVARGDLGVEIPLQNLPIIQKEIIRKCRSAGKPVVVATQMLDSMVHAPSPTRAEASDVATAIYDGADAVMLSAESASGQFPIESVTVMDTIIRTIESDPFYKKMMDDQRPSPKNTVEDAITTAARQVSRTVETPVIVALTQSGATALRAARERPDVAIIALSPHIEVARFLGVVWGCHAMTTEEIFSFSQMIDTACEISKAEEFAKVGDQITIVAGMPLGKLGGTNILRVAQIEE